MEARCESCTKGLCIWTRKHEQQKSINHFCFCLFLLNWAPLKWSGLGLLWAIFLTLLSVELKFILSIIKTISHVFLHDPSQKLLLELKFILPKHDYEICHCKGYTVLDCFKSGISVVHLVALGASGFAWNPCIHLQRLLRPVHSHLVARLWMRMRMRMLMRTTGVQSEDQNRRLIWSGKNVWPTPRDSMQRTLCLICFLMIKGVHASCSGIWQWFSNLFPHDFSPFFFMSRRNIIACRQIIRTLHICCVGKTNGCKNSPPARSWPCLWGLLRTWHQIGRMMTFM